MGSQQIKILPYFQYHPQIGWLGRVNRIEASKYYQNADIASPKYDDYA